MGCIDLACLTYVDLLLPAVVFPHSQAAGAANNWNVCSPSAAGGGLAAPDDWEIDISQLHIDSKVCAGGVPAIAQSA